MNKFGLYYVLVVYLATIVFSVISISTNGIDFHSLFFLFFALISSFCVYCVISKKLVKQVLSVLIVSYFLQSFGFYVFGILYKFVLGPNITLYFKQTTEFTVKLDFQVYDAIVQTNFVSDDKGYYAIGFNLIHLILFLYFNFLLYKFKISEAKRFDVQ